MPTDQELPGVLAERDAEGDLETARQLRDDVLATTLRNMEEIAVFFVRTDPIEGEQGRSLRDINNAYRHGTQVVYEDTSPEEIPWRAANPDEAQGMLVAAADVDDLARRETVNVLIEGPDDEGHARFASMPRSAEVNESLVARCATCRSCSGASSPPSSSPNSKAGGRSSARWRRSPGRSWTRASVPTRRRGRADPGDAALCRWFGS